MYTHHKSVLLGKDSLVDVPGRTQMWQNDGTHGNDLLPVRARIALLVGVIERKSLVFLTLASDVVDRNHVGMGG